MATSLVGDLQARLGIDTVGWVQGLNQAESTMERFGTRMFFIGSRITAGLGLPLAALAVSVGKVGMSFDQAMTESLAIIENVTPQIRSQMERLALDISETTKHSAEEAAQAYFFLASSGLTAVESMKALPVVARFAQAGVLDLERATELLSDAYIALGMRSKDPIQNMKNMARVADVLTQANNMAQGTVEQFAQALANRAAPAFRIWNISVEEGVAALAAYAERGVKGLKAGRQMFIILRDMQRAAVSNTEEWEKMNIEVFNSEGKFNKLADILEDMDEALDGLTDRSKRLAFNLLGLNDRSLQATLTLLGFHERIREFEAGMLSAGGVTQMVADRQILSFTNQLGLLLDRLKRVGIELFQAFEPTLRGTVIPLLEDGTRVIRIFSEWLGKLGPTTQTAILAFGALLIVLGPVLAIFGGFILAIRGLAVALDILKIATLGTVAVTGQLNLPLGLAASRTSLLGSAMTALRGPLGIALAAIAALTAGIIAWRTHQDIARQKFADGAEDFVKNSNDMSDALAIFLNATKAGTGTTDEFMKSAEDLGGVLGLSAEAFLEQATSGDVLTQSILNIIKARNDLRAAEVKNTKERIADFENEIQSINNELAKIGSGTARITDPDAAAGGYGPIVGTRLMVPAERIAATAAFTEKLNELNISLSEQIDLLQILEPSIDTNIQGMEDAATAAADLAADEEALAAKNELLEATIRAQNQALKQFEKNVQSGVDAILGNTKAVTEFRAILVRLGDVEDLNATQTKRLLDMYADLKDKTDLVVPSLDRLQAAYDRNNVVMVNGAKILKEQADWAHRVKASISGMYREQENFTFVTIDGTEALEEHNERMRETRIVGLAVADAQIEAARQAGIHAEELRILEEAARESREAFRALTRSLSQLEQALPEGMLKSFIGSLSTIANTTGVAVESVFLLGEGFRGLGEEGGSTLTSIANIAAGVVGMVAAIATGISLAIQLFQAFGRSIEENVTITVGRWGVILSEALTTSIADASRAGMSDIGAIYAHLGRIIAEAGGVMEFGLGKAISKTRDLFSMIQQGNLTVQEAGVVFDEVFREIMPNAIDEMTGIARADFLELIDLARRFGLESVAASEFIISEAETGASALVTVIEGATNLTRDNIAVMASAALGFFQAAIREGLSWAEIMEGPIGDAILAIPTHLERVSTGFDTWEGEVLDLPPAFLVLQEAVRAVRDEILGPFVASGVAAGRVLASLHNLALLDQEAFFQLGGSVTDSFNALIAGGVSGPAALLLLRGPLATLIYLQDTYGFEVDEGTQALIDLARQSGITGDDGTSDTEKMTAAMLALTDSIGFLIDELRLLIAEILGVPDIDVRVSIGNIPPVIIPWEWEDHGSDPGGSIPGTNIPVPSAQHGGIVPGSGPVPIIAHGGEMISTRESVRESKRVDSEMSDQLSEIYELLRDQPRRIGIAISDQLATGK